MRFSRYAATIVHAVLVTTSLAGVLSCESVLAESKLKALIVTGQGLHGWRDSSSDFQTLLEKSGRFEVKISQSPAPNAKSDNWESWNPVFSDYDVVVLEYSGDEWPERLRTALQDFVHDGGGMFLAHSVVGAFDEWPEYEDMIGIGWNRSSAGARIIYDEEVDDFLYLPRYHGAGAGHGKQHEFAVTARSLEHPIMKDLPPVWMQAQDELYHGMRGPAKDMEILATAFSDASLWGSANHEPVVWTVNYGQGRIVVTVLGHRMADDFQYDPEQHELDHGANGTSAVHSVGFQTLVLRGCEWAATGEVTTRVPAKFPTLESVSVIPPSDVDWRIE